VLKKKVKKIFVWFLLLKISLYVVKTLKIFVEKNEEEKI
jgi:hypothetical protein